MDEWRLHAPVSRLHGPCSLSSLAPSRSLRAPFNRSLSPRLHGLLPTTVTTTFIVGWRRLAGWLARASMHMPLYPLAPCLLHLCKHPFYPPARAPLPYLIQTPCPPCNAGAGAGPSSGPGGGGEMESALGFVVSCDPILLSALAACACEALMG